MQSVILKENLGIIVPSGVTHVPNLQHLSPLHSLFSRDLRISINSKNPSD